MKVSELINEVTSGFEGELFPSTAYLVAEYNRIIRSLLLILPTHDASITVSVKDKKLECELSPEQIRRVFCGDGELLRASRTLLDLMPEAKLYHVTSDGVYVTVSNDCTVYYRTLPDEVSVTDTETEIPLDMRYIPLIRAWLIRSVYLYVGDFDSSNAYSEEYNRLLEEFKSENGVAL